MSSATPAALSLSIAFAFTRSHFALVPTRRSFKFNFSSRESGVSARSSSNASIASVVVAVFAGFLPFTDCGTVSSGTSCNAMSNFAASTLYASTASSSVGNVPTVRTFSPGGLICANTLPLSRLFMYLGIFRGAGSPGFPALVSGGASRDSTPTFAALASCARFFGGSGGSIAISAGIPAGNCCDAMPSFAASTLYASTASAIVGNVPT
mmetsp:Transcript_14714/g.52961  ORF Transcript_14714/g.52961 Transcript_14714/m.52961 type:complete len:209 (-) Transcript_14714:223-849(-)